MRRKTVPVSYRDRSRDIRQPVCTSHFDSCETKVRATSPHYNKGAVHWLNGNGTEVPSWSNNIEKVKIVLVHFSLVQDGIFELEKALCTPPRLLENFQTLSFHICPSFIYINIYPPKKEYSFFFLFFLLFFTLSSISMLLLRPQKSQGLFGSGSPGRPPRLSHSSWALTARRSFVQCCFTSTETIRTIRYREPRTSTSTFTQLLSSDR